MRHSIAHVHLRRVLHVFGALLVLALALPAGASAHARLVASTPVADSSVDAVPDAVELRFSGPVTVVDDGIRVFAPSGAEVQVGRARPHAGVRVRQAIRSTETGTYGVSYTVSSEDGHVIKESLTFTVGDATNDGDAEELARDAARVDRGAQATFSAARVVELLALLTVAGGGIFACLLAPGWRPRALLVSSIVLLGAYATSLVATGAIVEGTTVGGALDADVLRAALETPYGRSVLLRGVVAAVAIGPVLLLRSGVALPPAARWTLAVVFVAVAASLSITGHAVTTQPTWLRLPLDMVHVTAAAIWFGGLVQLAALAPFAPAWVPALTRFSRTALACVVVLVATGAAAALLELDDPADLLQSTWGRLVVGKLLLLAGAIPLAWNNMRAFVPSVTRRPDDAPALLRQYVRRESALLVAVVVLTVWLIATPQPH